MLGPVEIALLGGAALLLFGPEQFPKVARRAGSIVRDVQQTSQQFIREMERAADLHDEPVAREDLISAGSGAGPNVAANTTSSNGFSGAVAHEHDDLDLPGLGNVQEEDGSWGYEPPIIAFEAPGPLGYGAAIDPSATLILADDGDVRHSVSLESVPVTGDAAQPQPAEAFAEA